MSTKISDISVEVCHIYLGELDEAVADRRASACAKWINPQVERWRQEGKSVSITIMVDDYFPSRWLKEGRTAEQAGLMMREACAGHRLKIDFVCYESACVPIAERMYRRLVIQPREGAGSRGGVFEKTKLVDDRAWLENGDVSRGTSNRGFISQIPKSEEMAVKPENRHALYLDIELFSDSREGERVWSCPSLAAAWQLARLGVDFDKNRGDALLANTSVFSPQIPFTARRTVTVLPPRMLPIEHAVRTIVGSLDLNAKIELAHLSGNKPMALGDLQGRLAYMFVDDDFEFDDPKAARGRE